MAVNVSVAKGGAAVFGCYDLTMQNFDAAPQYNGNYAKGNELWIKNCDSGEVVTAVCDEDGFFYLDGIEKYVPYKIEKFVIHPNEKKPDYTWEWTWSIDFMVTTEDVMDLGDIHTVWDAGSAPSSQNVDHGKAVSLYNKKFGASFVRAEITAGTRFSELEKFKNDVPDSRVTALLEDKGIKSLQKNRPGDFVSAVCKKIEGWACDDFEKVKLSHDVVALALTYDAESYLAGKIPAQDSGAVLRSGKAVCSGYAAVFKEFCAELRVPCTVVSGFAKGVSYNPNSKIIKNNHDWNIVQVDGAWYFVDCTWDSGYLDGRKNVKEYTTDYLFLEPERAIFSHYPENPEYQLLEKKFTEQDILFVPNLKSNVFNGKNPYTVQVKSFNALLGKACLVFSLTGCESLEVYCKSPSGKLLNLDCAYSEDYSQDYSGVRKKVTVNLKFKEKGIYTLGLKYKIDGWTWTLDDFAGFNWNP